jgi:non-ribosomal peptide synthetase component F
MRALLDDFDALASASPSAEAIVFADESRRVVLDYAELQRQTLAAARGLQAAGALPGSCVADFCDECPALVLAFLSIARAGATIVPIDPDAPAARLAFLLSDCEATIALCTDAALAMLRRKIDDAVPLVTLDEALRAGRVDSATMPPPLADGGAADSLSHLIFTSGSTGRPKAVACGRAALRAYARAKAAAHAVGPGARVLLASAHTWDPALGDVFSTLAAGGALCCCA